MYTIKKTTDGLMYGLFKEKEQAEETLTSAGYKRNVNGLWRREESNSACYFSIVPFEQTRPILDLPGVNGSNLVNLQSYR